MGDIFAIRDTTFFALTPTGPAARGNIRKFFSFSYYVTRKKIVFFSEGKAGADNIGVIPLFAIRPALGFALTVSEFRNRINNILRRSGAGDERKRNHHGESDNYQRR